MLHDTATMQDNAARFVTRAIESEAVWALKSADGYAWCESDDQEGSSVLIFWSDRAYAERARKAEFPEYVPDKIDLPDFLFAWLTGMAEDGVLAGPNWTADLAGVELDPADLQEQILEAMPEEMAARYKAQLAAEAGEGEEVSG